MSSYGKSDRYFFKFLKKFTNTINFSGQKNEQLNYDRRVVDAQMYEYIDISILISLKFLKNSPTNSITYKKHTKNINKARHTQEYSR